MGTSLSTPHALITEPYQLELTIHDQTELNAAVETATTQHLSQLNLTDKASTLSVLESAGRLAREAPALPLSLHYSIMHHYDGNARRAQENLQHFLAAAGQIETVSELLLLSGSARRSFDSITALETIADTSAKEIELPSTVSLGVAYNPFLQDDALLEEKERLFRKLQTGLVSRIYFQLGDDIVALRSGLTYLQQQRPDLPISAALLIPTEENIKHLRDRGWKGVRFSADYLQDVDSAAKRTQQLLEIYSQYDVEPLWEAV